MVKRKSTKEKLVEDNEEETNKPLILLSSSDDDEANEDLSLQIVEKARLRAKRKHEKDSDDNVRSIEAVIDLSSSSCEEVKGYLDRGRCGSTGVVTPAAVKEKQKKKKKKKKKKKVEEHEDKTVGVMESEELVETITSVETEPVNAVKTDKCVGTEGVEITDNIVLRKLLRGPRYFDPPERNCRSCYNCGEEGHNAVNCTSKKRKKPCFICGSTDHGVRNCTQGQDCFICNKQGHRAKDCPEKHQANSQAMKVCLRCGDLGHLMSSCSREYDPDDLKDIQCYVCKMPGHLCCVKPINPGTGDVSCYNCGQSGHTGTGCAKQRGESSGAVPATLCYKCGEEGHFARGCTTHSKPDRWVGESSTPTRKYSKKAKDSSGFRSAPPDLSKVHKKKNIQYENNFASEGRPKRRGRWITDDPGDLPNTKSNKERDFASEGRSKRRSRWEGPGDHPNRKPKDNSWRSPATPTNKNYETPARNNGNHPSNSRSPWRSSNFNTRTPSYSAYPPPAHNPAYPHYPITPPSQGFANPYSQMYTPSRFGNSIGSGDRRNYW